MGAEPHLLLGLDSGGTKTILALADRDGAVHLLERGPSLDPFSEPHWPDHLASLLQTCLPFSSHMVGGALGLSCHGEVSAVSARQIAVVAGLVPVPHLVLNDVRVAFDGAFAGSAGVLLLAGTGSMGWGGDGASRDARIGGWGSAFGDEGSAHWIGREALSLATRAIDGRGGDRRFAAALLDRLGLSADDLLATVLGAPNQRTALAAVALHVDALAEDGDESAVTILDEAGDHLADHVGALRRMLDLGSETPWSFAGGVFASRTVMRRVAVRLGGPAVPPRLPPVGGALLRAAVLSGWPANDTWIEKLAQSLAALDRADPPSTHERPSS